MRIFIGMVVWQFIIWITSAKENEDDIERYIISCHTTDFTCFKRQYRALRDHVFMGNYRFGIRPYEPYIFKYTHAKTCIGLNGLEDSELTGIRMDSITKEFSLTIELPFRIQQLSNLSSNCVNPPEVNEMGGEFVWLMRRLAGRVLHRSMLCHTPVQNMTQFLFTEFHEDVSEAAEKPAGSNNVPGAMKKFTGNATINVVYPYELRKKMGQMYMILKDENLDVILDIPDLSQHNLRNKFEKKLYELSEWAYTVVQHIDAAQHFALPYTSRFRTVMELMPLHRLLLLYPEEEYADLHFKYLNSLTKCYEKI